MKNSRVNLLIIEGILIILLVLFSGFLVFQNQRLVKELQEKSRPISQPTPTASPSPAASTSPSVSPTASPKIPLVTKNPTPAPTSISVP